MLTMSSWVERLKPKTSSQWVMAIGFLGSTGYIATEFVVSETMKVFRVPTDVLLFVATYFFMAQVLSHGVFTVGYISNIVVKRYNEFHNKKG